MSKKILLPMYFLLVACKINSFAQDFYIPFTSDFYDRYDPYLYKVNATLHTAFKPLRSDEMRTSMNFDSISKPVVPDKKFYKTWIGRKMFSEHLFKVSKDDYNLYLDVLFDFTYGRDVNAKTDESFYMNSRGFWLSGNIGQRFSFSTTFVENQADFPSYTDSLINRTHIVPGQGRTKKLYGDRDFAYATGTITYSLKKHFNFQFGHDKNFIGDGYRSLLLSDYAFNYPFLKINVDVWKAKYTFMLAAFQDILIAPPPNYNPEDWSFRKKWGSFHYLDLNIGKRASVGILEGVIWKSDSIRAEAIDINYFNPFIFFRPVEFSMSSPDNAMLGLNLKFKISSSVTTYGQLMIDDFKIEEVRAGTGWYGNKQAFQLGVKAFNMFRIKNLSALTEFNYVRPYMYSHRSSLTNYGHYNEALAHPAGANFDESVSIIKYHYKRWFTKFEFVYMIQGLDTGGLNYGSNILLPYDTRANEFGNYVPNGLKTTTTFASLDLGYMINPMYNLKAVFNVTSRKQTNERMTMDNLMFSFGIKTNLMNKYYDL